MIYIFSGLSLAAISATFILFIALHRVGRNYRILSNAVSDYGVGPTSCLFKVYITASISAYTFLAIAMAFVPAGAFSIKSLVLLCITIALRIGIAIFKTELEGEKITITGLVHYFFAILSFASLFLFVDSTSGELRKLAIFSNYMDYFAAFYWVFTASLVLNCVTLIPRLRNVFGLFERIYLVLGNCWIIAMAILTIIIGSNAMV